MIGNWCCPVAWYFQYYSGADPGFQVEGGALKFFFGVFRVKNHDFMQKKSYFFQS